MPKKRSKIDNFADGLVDSLIERGAEMFTRVREQQQEAIAQLHPPETLYTCGGCKKPFTLKECQMIDPRRYAQGYFGQCIGCWNFMLQAGQEKVDYLKRRAAQRAEGAAPGAAPPKAAPPKPPVAKPPWEVLGVDVDATVDEIRKAYRKLAAQYHDDRFNGMPGVTPEQRAAARVLFDEITRCRDAMLKVRGVATSTGTTG